MIPKALVAMASASIAFPKRTVSHSNCRRTRVAARPVVCNRRAASDTRLIPLLLHAPAPQGRRYTDLMVSGAPSPHGCRYTGISLSGTPTLHGRHTRVNRYMGRLYPTAALHGYMGSAGALTLTAASRVYRSAGRLYPTIAATRV